jgi:hypothetical protein
MFDVNISKAIDTGISHYRYCQYNDAIINLTSCVCKYILHCYCIIIDRGFDPQPGQKNPTKNKMQSTLLIPR